MALRTRTIALLSGGLDSAVMCAFLQKGNHVVIPLFIGYGQRAHDAEKRAATRVARGLRLPTPIHVNVSGLGGRKLGLLDSSPKKPANAAFPSHAEAANAEFVPQRNLFLLSIACIVAHQQDCGAVAIGVIGNDGTRRTRYPDIVPSYLSAAEKLLSKSQDIHILAPLLRFDKSRVVGLAGKLDLDIEITYSCNTGGKPCMACASCMERTFGVERFYSEA
jgi:7-cyano-7-deazaguanine synthase